MRRPTVKELHVLDNCRQGLNLDIDALQFDDFKLQKDGVTYADVLGTMRVNLKAMTNICNRLTDEQESTNEPLHPQRSPRQDALPQRGHR